ncbi:molybdopterin converting factor, small subunit 1 [Salinarchaeum sp. Harcht-Bsk1]|uniref:ubiquitin-like small modifier protein 1 n=1 Tax=Salinarchaeum sp. Harcht-Bsk1 TaxID=1333523 RepID=UPI000342465B|nr:ubiquitin-like small modifier protein 1 [Salinarchaeum sp. Harcht-Bsk1]AGN00451.1 molybdopterin converting factor, small subunit 1 [Salinarchaeum sp. Harcht-Bsk1]
MHWKLFADLAEVAGSDAVDVDAGADAETVGEALDALLADRPDLATRVLDEDGEVYDHVNVLKNGSDVTATDAGLETAVEDGDELALFPPVSGG